MPHAQLTSLHLARLGQVYTGPLLELGPNVAEVPDDVAGIVNEQLIDAGLFESEGVLSAQAHTLLDPLFGYDDAFSAIILLHNQRQSFTFDLDGQWQEYMSESLTTTPRVYVLVASHGRTVTTAVRAGDHVDITQVETSEPLVRIAAQELLRVGDPASEWSPADISALSFPASLLDHAPARAPIPGSADKDAVADHKETAYRFSSALRRGGVPSRTIIAVEKFLAFDHLAATHISFIKGHQRLISEGAATIDYFHDAGVSVGGLQLAGDGTKWRTLAPATQAETVSVLTDLMRLPSSPMLASLSGR